MLSFSYFTTSETEAGSWLSVLLSLPFRMHSRFWAGWGCGSQLPLPPHQRSPESREFRLGDRPGLAWPGTQCSPLALEPCRRPKFPPGPHPTPLGAGSQDPYRSLDRMDPWA